MCQAVFWGLLHSLEQGKQVSALTVDEDGGDC